MTDDTVVTAPKTKTTTGGSEYLILERKENEIGLWTQVVTVTARDSETAIRKHAESFGNKPGTFVAVPRKSWRPVSVTPETVTTLKLEEVK